MPWSGVGAASGAGLSILQFGGQQDEVLRGLVLGPDGSVFVAGEPAPFDFVSQQDAVGPAAGRRRATLKDRITAYHAGLPITRRYENRRRNLVIPWPDYTWPGLSAANKSLCQIP